MTEPGEMTFVEHGNPIDLSTWQWFDDDNALLTWLAKAFALQVTEVMREAFKEDPPRASFPFMWSPEGDGYGGGPVTDPVTIYVGLPLAAHSDTKCVFSISLESIIDDLIDCLQNYDDGKIHEEREIPDKIAARLRELAQKLDNTRPNEEASDG